LGLSSQNLKVERAKGERLAIQGEKKSDWDKETEKMWSISRGYNRLWRFKSDGKHRKNQEEGNGGATDDLNSSWTDRS